MEKPEGFTIQLPTQVMIKASSVKDAWTKGIWFNARYGALSWPDYNKATKRIDAKMIIDDPMKNFYLPDGSLNLPHLMHPIFLNKTKGIMVQGVLGMDGYIRKMSREYARVYKQIPDGSIEKEDYCYPDRIINSPKTLVESDVPNLLHNIRELANQTQSSLNNEFTLDIINLINKFEHKYDNPENNDTDAYYLDQFAIIRDMIGAREGSRRICGTLWVPQIDLLKSSDQPCFNWFKVENIGNGKAYAVILFRSWDNWGGYPFNIPAILNLFYEEILKPNNLELVRLVCYGTDLHIYQENWEEAKLIQIDAKSKEDILWF